MGLLQPQRASRCSSSLVLASGRALCGAALGFRSAFDTACNEREGAFSKASCLEVGGMTYKANSRARERATEWSAPIRQAMLTIGNNLATLPSSFCSFHKACGRSHLSALHPDHQDLDFIPGLFCRA